MNMRNHKMYRSSHLRQIPDVIGIEQQFLQTPRIAQYLLGHIWQRTVTLIDKFYLAIAALKYRNALEHFHSVGGVENKGAGLGCFEMRARLLFGMGAISCTMARHYIGWW